MCVVLSACGGNPQQGDNHNNTPQHESIQPSASGNSTTTNIADESDAPDVGWHGDHFHAPTPYVRTGLSDDDVIGTPILSVLAGQPQQATIPVETYQELATATTDDARFGWSQNQWRHVRDGLYHELDPAIRSNTKLAPFQAFHDSQVTTGGGIVDGMFVGDVDDRKQRELMERDAKPVDAGSTDMLDVYNMMGQWADIRDETMLDEFKTQHRPRAVRDNRFYTIPGEYSTVVQRDYAPFKQFRGLEDLRINHDYMFGRIRTDEGMLHVFFVRENNQWKMAPLNP